MSKNLETLIKTAAKLRARGTPWEKVAQEVQRAERTCRAAIEPTGTKSIAKPSANASTSSATRR
jgi:hypothetical protein